MTEKDRQCGATRMTDNHFCERLTDDDVRTMHERLKSQRHGTRVIDVDETASRIHIEDVEGIVGEAEVITGFYRKAPRSAPWPGPEPFHLPLHRGWWRADAPRDVFGPPWMRWWMRWRSEGGSR